MVFYVVDIVNFGSEWRSPRFFDHLVRYLIIGITPRRMYQLGSFLNMMRISSSATSCIKGVCFCSAVLEKLASKLDLDLSPRSGWHHPAPVLNLWILWLQVTKLVFWIARLMVILSMYTLYSVFAGLEVQFWLCRPSTLLLWPFGTVHLCWNISS